MPEQLVVVWQTSLWNWFFLLLSISLVVLGSIGFALSFRLEALSEERRRAPKLAASALQSFAGIQKSTDWPTVPDVRIVNESPGTHLVYRLPLNNQPIFPLVGIAVTAGVWIIVAGVILSQPFTQVNTLVDVFADMFTENTWPDLAMDLGFRVLFFGMGIFLAIWVIRQLLLTFRLAPTLLEISDHPIYPGRRYRILLQHTGTLKFHKLSVDLVSEEIARFRHVIFKRRDAYPVAFNIIPLR